MPQARCNIAIKVSGSFSHRTSIRRKRFIPLLARLAVDVNEQGCGTDAGLLKDALKRLLQAQAIIGARALVVHAKNDEAVEYYRHFGFVESPLDPYHLFLLSKDIQAALG